MGTERAGLCSAELPAGSDIAACCSIGGGSARGGSRLSTTPPSTSEPKSEVGVSGVGEENGLVNSGAKSEAMSESGIGLSGVGDENGLKEAGAQTGVECKCAGEAEGETGSMGWPSDSLLSKALSLSKAC